MTTGVLAPVPVLQFFGNDGNPAVGGYVLTQIGSADAATYQDVGLGTPLPNPIPLNSRGEVSTSFGATSQCFLTPNQVYTFTLYDQSGNQLWVATYVNGVQVDITQASIGAVLWPYDVRFDGAPVVDTGWIYGDPRRFGAIGDDATDDTAALIAWASGAGSLILPDLTFLITDEITLLSDTHIIGCEGSTIHQTKENKGIFRNTNGNNIDIEDVHYNQTVWGADAYVAHVIFDGTAHGTVTGCEFEGIQWGGVYLRAARHCTVRGNYFHDSQPQLSLTFTSPPAATSVTATLSAPWAYPDGNYTVAFVETAGGAVQGKVVAFVNGATSAVWSGGLTNNCNAAFTTATATDSGDVIIHSSPSASASWNIVDGNFCYSNTLEVGVSIEDPYSGFLPTRNIVCNNRINEKTGYGVIVYMPDSGDSYNQVIGNLIDGILGNFPLNQSSGAGIYMVGAGSGGTIIANNEIRNCCIDTINTTLAPAGIGCAGTSASTQPISVTGNSIDAMTQYHGILLTGILGGASVSGNVIRQPSTNITGDALRVTNGNAVSLTGNTITQLNTTTAQRGIIFAAITLNATNHVCANNTITGGFFSQIETGASGGGSVVGLVISGNTLMGGGTGCIPLLFSSGTAADVAVTGNFINSTTADCIKQVACTGIIYTGNRISAGGTVAFETSGACTGSRFSRSNTGVAGNATCKNAGTGCIVELYASTIPTTGTFAVGDNLRMSVPVVGQTLGWSCTAPGAPGTLVPWANL